MLNLSDLNLTDFPKVRWILSDETNMKKITLAFVCLICGVSCMTSPTLKNASGGSNNMAFDSVRFVHEFPIHYQVSEGTEANTGLIGLRDFTIHDSLMIVMTTNPDGYWAFLSMPDFKILGRFLRKGNGPNEFLMPPYVSHATIYKEHDRLYMIILNQIKRCLLRMDIDSSIDAKKLTIEPLNDSLPRSLFGFAYINDTTYFCRTITNDETQQIRFFLENNKKRIPAYLERLNNARVRRGADFNYLSSIIKYNLKEQMVVETSSTLNHINLYSFDGSKTRTICVGKKLDNIDELQALPNWKMPYSYMNLRVYPHFFGALFLGETKKTFQTKRVHMPKIQLFDWNGDPLAEILLDRQATSFDIDFVNGNLYILDGQTEEFYRYDIGNLLALIDHEH